MDELEFLGSCREYFSWWVFTLPASLGTKHLCDGAVTLVSILAAFLVTVLFTWAMTPGSAARRHGRNCMGPTPIPGPRGLLVLGSVLTLSSGPPHRTLAAMARAATGTPTQQLQLMAFSIGATPTVVSSDPTISREILSQPNFADRPLRRSARELVFGRAMGFAPSGAHWRLLRRVAASHLFSPRRVAAHEPARQADCSAMLDAMAAEQASSGRVQLRRHLQGGAISSVMGSVLWRRQGAPPGKDAEAAEIERMVREGFEVLGVFNWSDHLPWLGAIFDPRRLTRRCAALVADVRRVVGGIIKEHRAAREAAGGGARAPGDGADFVDVLLALDGDEKLDEDDIIAVLWEMIFHGTDTTGLLTEWSMAELVVYPGAQAHLRAEVDVVADPTGAAAISGADVARLPYLQAVVKETLRLHPPGPLLSWACLSTADFPLGNGMVVPAGTTAMVSIWAIAHDAAVWDDSDEFRPGRCLPEEGGADVDVRGGDLRLAPFGAGRRVCPGRNLALATVGLSVARLVHRFEWVAAEGEAVDMEEVLKLSLQLKKPLVAVAVPRTAVAA